MEIDRRTIAFPVLCFWSRFVRVEDSWEALTTTTRAGVKNGCFRNMLLVDPAGRGIRIVNAHKVRGLGWFWGYSLFLNQTIQVRLDVSGGSFAVSVEEVKRMLFESFRRWEGWASSDGFDELRRRVREASSIAEVIPLMR